MTVSFDPHNDSYREYENAYEFCSVARPEMIGPQPCVIVQEAGERLFWSDEHFGGSDTTACVAGALAGAHCGYESIPEEWIESLHGKDSIERSLFWGGV